MEAKAVTASAETCKWTTGEYPFFLQTSNSSLNRNFWCLFKTEYIRKDSQICWHSIENLQEQQSKFHWWKDLENKKNKYLFKFTLLMRNNEITFCFVLRYLCLWSYFLKKNTLFLLNSVGCCSDQEVMVTGKNSEIWNIQLKKLQIVSILSRINDAAKKEAEVVAEVTELTWSGDVIKSIKFIFV